MNLRSPRSSALYSPTLRRTQSFFAVCTQHPRRLLVVLVLFSLFIFFTLFHLPTSSPIDSSTPYVSVPVPLRDHPKTISGGDGWRFVADLDERNYGLTEEQCDAAFPGYWAEIDRAVEFRRKHVGKVKEEDVDIGWRDDGVVRAMIYNRQLYIVEAKGVNDLDYHFRSLGILHQIHRAISSCTDPIPDIEFSFSVDDMADPDGDTATIWAFSRLPHKKKQWVMPDYNYWSWPMDVVGDYSEVRTKIRDLEYQLGKGAPNPNPKDLHTIGTNAQPGPLHTRDDNNSSPVVPAAPSPLSPRDFFSPTSGDRSFDAKLPLLIWRGANLNDVRDSLLRVTAPNPPWADVLELNWLNASELQSRIISMPTHCRYRFVVHTEGRSYSGRLKYLQNCHSVPFLHRWEWTEAHHHLLIPEGPDQNFVLVERDFSDLEPKIQALLDRPKEARRIADNSVRDFRDKYLTPAAQACYWRKLFKGWASVQDFTPSLYKDGKRGEEWQALSFESYVLRSDLNMERVGWSEEEIAREKARWDLIREERQRLKDQEREKHGG